MALPSTLTHTSIPTTAVALGTLVEILVSVKRPVTSEGRTSNVVPFPFDVEMSAVKFPTTRPPLRAPVVLLITHAEEPPAALKLPLDCANPVLHIKRTAAIDAILFIILFSFSGRPGPSRISSPPLSYGRLLSRAQSESCPTRHTDTYPRRRRSGTRLF